MSLQEIIQFAATWIALEDNMLNEVRKRGKILDDLILLRNVKTIKSQTITNPWLWITKVINKQ